MSPDTETNINRPKMVTRLIIFRCRFMTRSFLAYYQAIKEAQKQVTMRADALHALFDSPVLQSLFRFACSARMIHQIQWHHSLPFYTSIIASTYKTVL